MHSKYHPNGSSSVIPTSIQKYKDRCHKFGIKTLPAIFIGYVQQEGGGWSGDVEVIDSEALHNADSVHSVH